MEDASNGGAASGGEGAAAPGEEDSEESDGEAEAIYDAALVGDETPAAEEEGGGAASPALEIREGWDKITFASSLWGAVGDGGAVQLRTVEDDKWVQYILDKNSFQATRREFAQFAERFTLLRGMLGKERKPHYQNAVPCDDAVVESDNFAAVFDGVGGGGVQSGMFARLLAKVA